MTWQVTKKILDRVRAAKTLEDVIVRKGYRRNPLKFPYPDTYGPRGKPDRRKNKNRQ